jgi:DNA polymerase III epsilon subunit-like protein
LRKILYIDFEGSLTKGIRELGYLITEDEQITYSAEETGLKAIQILQKLQLNNYSFIVSHNSHIEKNLIKKYFPYEINQVTQKIRKHNWLDTLKLYRNLYPALEKYDLKFLVDTFIDERELASETEKRCSKGKHHFHNSLFDAICVYLLTKRLKKTINLEHFLNLK